jgi:hypothetical protein
MGLLVYYYNNNVISLCYATNLSLPRSKAPQVPEITYIDQGEVYFKEDQKVVMNISDSKISMVGEKYSLV